MDRAGSKMKAAAMAGLVVVLCGCRQSRTDLAVSELLGTYTKRLHGETELIEIRSDGSYRHTLPWGRVDEAEWRVNRFDGSTFMILSGFDTSGWPRDLPGAGSVLSVSLIAAVERGKVTLAACGGGCVYIKQ